MSKAARRTEAKHLDSAAAADGASRVPSVGGYSSVKDTRRGVKPCLGGEQPGDVRRQTRVFTVLCLQSS
jgi:hypothetical protein